MKKVYNFGVAPGTNEYYRLWRAANRERVRARAKKYYYANPQKQRDRSTKYKASEHGKKVTRARMERHKKAGITLLWNLRNRLKKFGMTVNDYKAILESQNGGCAICHSQNARNNRSKRLFVDHCHATNRVRGLLCSHCNSALGHMSDIPELLERAAAYLRQHARP